jgi:hypothetical protein
LSVLSRHSGHSSIAHTAEGKRSAKFADPPQFYNDDKKDTITFEVWHRQMLNKLVINADHYPNDYAKMAYIGSRLGGPAASSLEPYLIESHPNAIKTADDLIQHLWEEYHDPNATEKAIADLANLTMSAGSDFNKFKSDYIRLAGESQKAKSEWLADFYRKLPSYLKVSLADKYHEPGMTFDNFTRHATKIALIHKSAYKAREEKRTNGKTPATRGGRGGSTGGTARGGTTTSSTTGGARTRTAPRHSAEKLRQLITEGKCFECEKVGHTTRDCPEKKAGNRLSEARIQALVEQFSGQSRVEEVTEDTKEDGQQETGKA